MSHVPAPSTSDIPALAYSGSALLDRDGLASYLGVPPRMAYRLMYERRITTVKIGRYVRVRIADAAAYLTANARPAVTE